MYSYLFHFALALFILALSVLAMTSTTTLKLDMLPWQGEELIRWLLGGGLLGIASVLLAMTGIFRFLFPLWALFVLVMMVRGYLLQPYTFSGRDSFYQALWLIAGALLAFLASLTLFRARRRRRR